MRKSKTMIRLQISDTSSLELRGRQSVRTTFKLSEKSINALSILACQMGIKQKSLFDHLIDDVQLLKAIAEQAEGAPSSERRIPKTYVISRKTLENLEYISSRYNIPRDLLVEFSVERILPLVEQEKAKHEKRKVIAEELTARLRQSLKLLEKAEKELGEDDPLVYELRSMLRNFDLSFKRICDFIEKGRRIEDF